MLIGRNTSCGTKSFSSPKAAILVVSATFWDLWQGPKRRPKQEVRESRTFRRLCAASEIWNNNGYHRLQKWAAIALACYPGPCQRSWSVALAKRIAALGTRMVQNRMADIRRYPSFDFIDEGKTGEEVTFSGLNFSRSYHIIKSSKLTKLDLFRCKLLWSSLAFFIWGL